LLVSGAGNKAVSPRASQPPLYSFKEACLMLNNKLYFKQLHKEAYEPLSGAMCKHKDEPQLEDKSD
jgi:hypothetical protein